MAFWKEKVDTRSQILISEELPRQERETSQIATAKNSYLYASTTRDSKASQVINGSQTLMQGTSLLSSANPSGYIETTSSYSQHRSSIVTYKVQPGDTLSYIASLFGVSTNTILWANDLNYWGLIRPGDKLTILPVSGVMHKVTKGETLSKIVGKYSGDVGKTIEFNGLPADGSIKLAQKIIIPGGKKPIYYNTQPRVKYASYTGPYSGQSHRFPWGQCTWYVAQKRYVPWSGHAKNWLANAQAMGYATCRGTGCEPKPGAIMSLTGTTWLIRLYGHVGYVESVNGNWVTFSEANYTGLGRRSVRTINKNSWQIRGYIY